MKNELMKIYGLTLEFQRCRHQNQLWLTIDGNEGREHSHLAYINYLGLENPLTI